MHDYGTGLDMKTFKVTANFDIDGVKAGENLASRFKTTSTGVWEMRPTAPPDAVSHGKMRVEIRDRQGNSTRIERTFSLSKK